MKNEELLEKLGLDKNASKIYLALVELGPALISQIAKYTGLHRPTIYQALPNLKNADLLTIVPKGKHKLYTAQSPERLNHLLDSLKDDLEKFTVDLKEIYENKKRPSVTIFLEGKKALKSVFEDLVTSLKRGDVFYRYSSRRDTVRGGKYWPKDYEKRRDAKNLQRFVITSEMLAREKSKNPKLDIIFKVVPAKYGLFDYNVVQLIYGDKVAVLDFNTETGVVIESKNVAEFQKKIFKVLYDLL